MAAKLPLDARSAIPLNPFFRGLISVRTDGDMYSYVSPFLALLPCYFFGKNFSNSSGLGFGVSRLTTTSAASEAKRAG